MHSTSTSLRAEPCGHGRATRLTVAKSTVPPSGQSLAHDGAEGPFCVVRVVLLSAVVVAATFSSMLVGDGEVTGSGVCVEDEELVLGGIVLGVLVVSESEVLPLLLF